jgi:hypothetical protein
MTERAMAVVKENIGWRSHRSVEHST